MAKKWYKFWEKEEEKKEDLEEPKILLNLQSTIEKYYGNYLVDVKMPVTFEITLNNFKSEIYYCNGNLFTKVGNKWIWSECLEIFKA